MRKNRLILRTIILLVLVLAVGYTVYANFSKDSPDKAVVGKQAPDFVLKDLNGEKHTLSDFEGKGVLLNFWATWCPPCQREMPYMNKLYEEYKNKGVEIIAVNIGESKVVVDDFANRYKLKFPILIDTKSEVSNVYNVGNLPVTYLIDKDGKIVGSQLGEMKSEKMVRKLLDKIIP